MEAGVWGFAAPSNQSEAESPPQVQVRVSGAKHFFEGFCLLGIINLAYYID